MIEAGRGASLRFEDRVQSSHPSEQIKKQPFPLKLPSKVLSTAAWTVLAALRKGAIGSKI
jgi:hypothetical protein